MSDKPVSGDIIVDVNSYNIIDDERAPSAALRCVVWGCFRMATHGKPGSEKPTSCTTCARQFWPNYVEISAAPSPAVKE